VGEDELMKGSVASEVEDLEFADELEQEMAEDVKSPAREVAMRLSALGRS